MVSSTMAVGGTLRCVTLATKDNLALEKWMSFLEQVGRSEDRKTIMLPSYHYIISRSYHSSAGQTIVRIAELTYNG